MSPCFLLLRACLEWVGRICRFAFPYARPRGPAWTSRPTAAPISIPALSLVCVALLAAGCGETRPPAPASTPASTPASAPAPASAGHHHSSLHGGTAVELGAHEFQLDVVFTPAEGLLQCYVMDGHMANFVRIAAPALSLTAKLPSGETTLELLPMANHATGEQVGNTSLFQTQNPLLKGLPGFVARLKEISIRGRNYSNIVLRLSPAGAVTPAQP